MQTTNSRQQAAGSTSFTLQRIKWNCLIIQFVRSKSLFHFKYICIYIDFSCWKHWNNLVDEEIYFICFCISSSSVFRFIVYVLFLVIEKEIYCALFTFFYRFCSFGCRFVFATLIFSTGTDCNPNLARK